MSDDLPPAYPGATQWDIGEKVEFSMRRMNFACSRCGAVVAGQDRQPHASWHYGQDRAFAMIRTMLWPS